MDKAESNFSNFLINGRGLARQFSLPSDESALYRLSTGQKILFSILIFVLSLGLFFDWKNTLIAFVATITVIYFADLIFNLYLIIKSFITPPEIYVEKEELEKLLEWTLPTYTILCPLYKEWKVLSQFLNGIGKLDYPKEKLQVILLLEKDDSKTIQKAREFSLQRNIQLVLVPHERPRTKPKALNYGLGFATGENVVIYDAEDVPEPQQLKKAVIAFQKADIETKCIQAKLNFYNPRQNVLTRVFTAEYSLWFDLVLTGLQSIHAPIPLGGTSNHFKTKDLLSLFGWDAFNVTEDADLGIRLAKKGFRTAIINSTTYEEANSRITNWFWQRSRWIKGYMQTYLVHTRKPGRFFQNHNKTILFTFQMVIGGKVASMLINPLMWIITISYFVFRENLGPLIESFFPLPVFYLGIVSLIVGNFLYMYYYMIGCAKRGEYDIIKYVFLVPLYWLGMSIAAYFSLYKLIVNPHYWSKTKHGLHIKKTPDIRTIPQSV